MLSYPSSSSLHRDAAYVDSWETAPLGPGPAHAAQDITGPASKVLQTPSGAPETPRAVLNLHIPSQLSLLEPCSCAWGRARNQQARLTPHPAPAVQVRTTRTSWPSQSPAQSSWQPLSSCWGRWSCGAASAPASAASSGTLPSAARPRCTAPAGALPCPQSQRGAMRGRGPAQAPGGGAFGGTSPIKSWGTGHGRHRGLGLPRSTSRRQRWSVRHQGCMPLWLAGVRVEAAQTVTGFVVSFVGGQLRSLQVC